MYKVVKRILDVLLSLIGMIVFLPLYMVISILIKSDSKGKVIFKQKRIGIKGRDFYIYKFRTMYELTPDNIPTHKLKNSEQYITKIGKLLRKTSLDELPQLINILKGDMSIVGPRPALWNQYDLLKEREKYSANDIQPGLTGLAQINGRDELSIKQKAQIDGEYVKKMNAITDFLCFIKTIHKVVKGEDIVDGG